MRCKKIKNAFFFIALLVITSSVSMGVPGGSSKKNYKNAYRDVISKFEKKYIGSSYLEKDHYIFDLIYIDNDRIPELVCDHYSGEKRITGDFEIYTFYNGKAKCLFKGYTPQYYLLFLPKKNSVLVYRNAAVSKFYAASVSLMGVKKGTLKTRLKEALINKYPELERKRRYCKSIIGKYSKKKILKKLK